MQRNLFLFLIVVQWRLRVFAANGPPATCCIKYRTAPIKLKDIKCYELDTHSTCLLKAIKFVTTNGKTLCYDLKNEWARRVIQPRFPSPCRPTASKPPTAHSLPKCKSLQTSTSVEKKLPWTLKRLRKQSKKGLRRVQMECN